MTYKVIQWATGNNGRALLRGIIDHPDLDLVGCRVYSDDKDGMDAGVIAGRDPIGVKATNDRQAIIDMDADVVLYCPMLNPDRTQMDQDLVDLLASGKNVIETSGYNTNVLALGKDVSRKFEEACAKGGATLHGAGLDPGWAGERLAATVTGLCTHVDVVTVTETYDCSYANADMVFGAIGFGMTPDERRDDSPFVSMFTTMYTQLLGTIAHQMGSAVDRIELTNNFTLAEDDIELTAGTVKKGTICVIDCTWRAYPKREGDAILEKRTVWKANNPSATADDMATFDNEDVGWEVKVEGVPSVKCKLSYVYPERLEDHHALYVGAAIPAVPVVVEADPGILLPTVFAPFKKRFA